MVMGGLQEALGEGLIKADARRDLVDRVRRVRTGAPSPKKAAGDFARLALATSRLSRRGQGLHEQPKANQ